MGYHSRLHRKRELHALVQIVIMVLGVFPAINGSRFPTDSYKLSEKTLKLAFTSLPFNTMIVGASTNLRFGSDEGVLAANVVLGLTAIAMILYHIINHFVNSD